MFFKVFWFLTFFLSFSVFAASNTVVDCPKNYSLLEGSTKVGRPQIQFARSAANPKEVDLAASLGDLEGRVFIGIENWGHTFLQVGDARFDGHVLKPTIVKKNHVTMRDGHVIELEGLDPQVYKKIQSLIAERNEKPSLSCVREILNILESSAGFSLKGENKNTIWLTDIADSLIKGDFDKGSVRSVSIASSSGTEDIELLRRVKKSEERWRNETIARALGLKVGEFDLANSTFPKDAIVKLSEESGVKVEEVEYLAAQILGKVKSGLHSTKANLTNVAELPLEKVQAYLDEDARHTFLWDSQNSDAILAKMPKDLSGTDKALFEKLIEEYKTGMDFDRLIQIAEKIESEDFLKKMIVDVLKKLSYRRIAKVNFRNLDAKAVRDLVIKELKRIQRKEQFLENLLKSNKVPNVSARELLVSTGGLPLEQDEISKVLRLYKKEMKPEDNHSELLSKRFLDASKPNEINLESLSGLKRSDLKSFAISELKPIQNVLDRLNSGTKHTLDVDGYIERHLSKPLIKLIEESNMPIKVIAAPVEEASQFLKKSGFSKIQVLPNNGSTDFEKWIAVNPTTGESEFIIRTLNGRSSSQEALAHLMLHSRFRAKPISSRIELLRSSRSVEEEFAEILKRNDLDADIISFGSVSAMDRIIRSKKGSFIKLIDEDGFRGMLFELNHKKVLLLPIEPNFFGDRAGAFVSAVVNSSHKKPKVLFSGTAGSLVDELKIHDLVFPKNFSHANDLDSPAITEINNLALKALDTQIDSKNLKKDANPLHVAVDSILFEDSAWLKTRVDKEGKIIVEQELADIAKVVKENDLEFYGVIRISDELATGIDFSKVELNGVDASSPDMYPSEALGKSLDEAIK
ncbi:MAG: hypothetical protein M9962_14260 [Oligoflexia bacterium]|nr:hypothetical protein [Oligoflexia bacterium]